MNERQNIDGFGAGALIAFFLLLAVNQVVIKLTNEGLQPVFAAGLRSAGATLVLWLWIRARGRRLEFRRGTLWAGLLVGVIFSAEFLCLFLALDMTTVTRTSVIFYSMPVWMALAAHFLLPGERLTPVRSIGLALAFAGVVWAITNRPAGAAMGAGSVLGDLFALGAAFGWMGVSLAARITPIARLRPEMQIFWQVAVSTPILLAAAPLFGPLIRAFQPIHIAGIAFQAIAVASAAFLFWFWLLTRYKASAVASFAFLAPVFGVFMGWAWLGEEITPGLIGALGLVSVGIILINHPAK